MLSGSRTDLAGSAEALPASEEAVAATDGSPARVEHNAASLLAHGSLAAARHGSRRSPGHRWSSAAGLAPGLWGHTARDRAYAGVPRRRRATALAERAPGVDALTPSERRVAALAASRPV